MSAFNIYHDLEIFASKQALFNALSEPIELEKWWPNRCKGECVLGAVYNFHFSEEYDWYAKIERLKPNTFIEYKMTQSDPDWNATSFSFKLIEKGERTLLEFAHCNWPENNHHFRRSSFCWAMLLNGLKNYLEKGIVVPFESRE